MAITLWHNPRCSTSRKVLAMIRARGIEPEIFEYLAAKPSAPAIKDVLAKLGIGARDLLRKKEPAYRAAKLDDPALGEAALIRAMAADPILIERPLVLKGRRGVLARPPERALELL